MDWLRRNWPDLLIGVALVAVIAMIVATLLGGGSLASLVRRDTPPDLAITDTTGTDAAGTTAAGTSAAGTNTAGTADTTDAAGTVGGADYDVFVPDVPGQPADGAAREQGADGGTRGGGAGTGSQAAGALPQAAAAGGYRVAAGATPSRDAAATLAQSYRDEGYEATVEQQGDLYLLWIGPYASDAGAERVAARLRADGLVPDALVYTYGGNVGEEDETAAGATDGAAAEGTLAQVDAQPSGATGAAEVAQAGSQNAGGVATAGVGQRYLQVGAFASDESAEPRRVQLENLGLNVSRSEDASGLVRLYVGPFGGAQLAQAQRRLSAAGIVDAFPVTR